MRNKEKKKQNGNIREKTEGKRKKERNLRNYFAVHLTVSLDVNPTGKMMKTPHPTEIRVFSNLHLEHFLLPLFQAERNLQ